MGLPTANGWNRRGFLSRPILRFEAGKLLADGLDDERGPAMSLAGFERKFGEGVVVLDSDLRFHVERDAGVGRLGARAKWTLILWNADEVSIQFRPAASRKSVLAAFLSMQ